MKKKESLIIISTLLFFFIFIFIYSKEVSQSIIFSISLWKDNLLPSLFPFLLVSELLIEYGFIDLISSFLGKYMVIFFNLPKESSYAFFTSLFSGFPSGSKYVKDLLEKKLLTEEEANYLIMFTHYSNPLFIVSTIGILLLNNIKYGYIILFSHILSNILVAFIYKKKKKIYNVYNKKELKEHANYLSMNNKIFITVLINAIWKSFKILLNMLGIIMFFLMITTIVNKLFYFPPLLKATISGLLEMTQGVNYISKLNLSINIKSAIIGAMISFSGLSIHFQVKSIIETSKIKYKNFLIARITQSIICFWLIMIISKIL